MPSRGKLLIVRQFGEGFRSNLDTAHFIILKFHNSDAIRLD